MHAHVFHASTALLNRHIYSHKHHLSPCPPTTHQRPGLHVPRLEFVSDRLRLYHRDPHLYHQLLSPLHLQLLQQPHLALIRLHVNFPASLQHLLHIFLPTPSRHLRGQLCSPEITSRSQSRSSQPVSRPRLDRTIIHRLTPTPNTVRRSPLYPPCKKAQIARNSAGDYQKSQNVWSFWVTQMFPDDRIDGTRHPIGELPRS